MATSWIWCEPMADRLTPLRAIRAFCREKCCLSSREVKLCPQKDCFLYEYRFGRNSARTGIGVCQRDSQGRYLAMDSRSSRVFSAVRVSKGGGKGNVLRYLPRANAEEPRKPGIRMAQGEVRIRETDGGLYIQIKQKHK